MGYGLIPAAWGSPSHNAHLFETVTVYYRWHPLFGQSLRVCRRRWKNNTVCQLPDNTALCIPSWMLSPECARLSLGPPQIAVDALMQLRHLLSSLQLTSACDKPSLDTHPQGGVDEAKRQADRPAVQSVTAERSSHNDFPRQAKATQTGTHGVADRRRLPKSKQKRRQRRRR